MKLWQKLAVAAVGALLVVAVVALGYPRLRSRAPTVRIGAAVPAAPSTRDAAPSSTGAGRHRHMRRAPAAPEHDRVADPMGVQVGPILRVPTVAEAPDPIPGPEALTAADTASPRLRRTAFGTPAVGLPRLLNQVQVARAARHLYPAELRRAPVAGMAIIRVRIGEDGQVRRRYIAATSGNALLDQAALGAAALMRFVPARFEGEQVRSEVDVPIAFRAAAREDVARTGR